MDKVSSGRRVVVYTQGKLYRKQAGAFTFAIKNIKFNGNTEECLEIQPSSLTYNGSSLQK